VSKGEETRERIVERAWRMASRDGLSGLSIGKLASELGLSKSGLFAHFGSKEDLEVAVLKSAADRFTDEVIRPALQAPRGIARLRKMFKNWMIWVNDPGQPGGCIFLATSAELDDGSGPQRDFLVAAQSGLRTMLAKAARFAVEAGELRADLDCEQFAFDMQGIIMAYQHSRRLLRDPKAEQHVRAAFERLLSTNAAG